MIVKHFFTTIILLAFINTAFGQSLKIGIKAGTDFRKVTGKSFDEEYKIGYHLGAFAIIKFKKIGIQPEVYFSQVNARQGNDSTSIFNINNISKADLSYLNIPILLNINFNKNVALQLGPQYGILFNKSNSVKTNGEDAFKKGDFSLVAGMQLKFSKLRVYGRYQVGLTDLNDFNNKEKWKSQALHIGVGLTIL